MVKENDCTDLVVQARLGNRDSLSALAVRVHARLYPYLYRATCDHHVSQDLLQEVLLTMVCRIGSLARPESFWPWIYKIARSKIHQYLKLERRRQILNAEVFDDAYHMPQCSNSSVLELLARQEARRSVSLALRRLDRRYRDVVRLRCFERMSYLEIACRTQSSPEVARIRFLRAKNSLKSSPVVAAVAGD